MLHSPQISMKLLVGLIALPLALVACSASSGSQAALSSSDVESFGDAFSDLNSNGLGLNDLTSFDPDSHVFLRNATGELIRRCMSREGFDYEPLSYQASDFFVAFRSPDQLRATGYGVTRSDWSNEPDSNQQILGALDSAEREAWTDTLFGDRRDQVSVILPNGNVVGMSKTGCVSEATEAIYGDLGDSIVYEEVLYNVTGDSVYLQVIADPRHRELAAVWRKCMSDFGTVVDPQVDSLKEAAVDLYRTTDEMQAFENEMALADNDAHCLELAGLDRMRFELVEEVQERTSRQGDFDVARAAAFQSAALQRAQSLLSE